MLKKKIISLLIIICMVLTMTPTAVLGVGEGPTAITISAQNTIPAGGSVILSVVGGPLSDESWHNILIQIQQNIGTGASWITGIEAGNLTITPADDGVTATLNNTGASAATIAKDFVISKDKVVDCAGNIAVNDIRIDSSKEHFVGKVTFGENPNKECEFIILTYPEGNQPGTVQVGTGKDAAVKVTDNEKYSLLSLTMPQTVIGEDGTEYVITTIADFAFQSMNFYDLVIPESIISIGESAFKNCAMHSLSFAEGSKIEHIADNAFSFIGYKPNGTKPKLIAVIPASVKSIGKDAFSMSLFNTIRFMGAIPTMDENAFKGTYYTGADIIKTVCVPYTEDRVESVTLNGITTPFTPDSSTHKLIYGPEGISISSQNAIEAGQSVTLTVVGGPLSNSSWAAILQQIKNNTITGGWIEGIGTGDLTLTPLSDGKSAILTNTSNKTANIIADFVIDKNNVYFEHIISTKNIVIDANRAMTPTLVAPVITTDTLPDGTVGTPYLHTLAANGDTPITWSLETGSSLPAGLTLASTGVISGTPTTSETVTFTVKAANGVDPAATKELNIVVNPAPVDPVAPVITTDTLPDGTVGTTYSQTLTATGDTPITWSLETGNSLPAGLTLASTGVISGTPTASGTVTFTVKASNGVDPAATKELNITIAARQNSGGGHTGGSSSDGSSVGSWTVDTGNTANMPTLASLTLTDKPNQNGNLTMNITKNMVEDGIGEAERKWSGRESYGASIAFNNTSDGAESLTTSIEAAALDNLVSQGVKSMSLQSGIYRITLDEKVIKSLDNQSTGNVTVTVAPYKVSGTAATVIGSRPVFEITFKDSKGTEISNFGSGTITRGIKYTAASGEDSGSLFIVKVTSSGVEWITNSRYENGWVIWNGNSNSVYGVGYKTAVVFIDTQNHWAKDNIDFVVSRELLSGVSSTTFAPNTAITRADFLMALGKLSGVDVSGYKTSSFIDVVNDSTAMTYIEWAYKNGIVSGTGNNQFSPNAAITREQMAVMMQNYAKVAGFTMPVSRQYNAFTDDSKISSWSKDAVKAIAQAGIIIGKEDGKFDPQGNATRAEAATILHRFVELVID